MPLCLGFKPKKCCKFEATHHCKPLFGIAVFCARACSQHWIYGMHFVNIRVIPCAKLTMHAAVRASWRVNTYFLNVFWFACFIIFPKNWCEAVFPKDCLRIHLLNIFSMFYITNMNYMNFYQVLLKPQRPRTSMSLHAHACCMKPWRNCLVSTFCGRVFN